MDYVKEKYFTMFIASVDIPFKSRSLKKYIKKYKYVINNNSVCVYIYFKDTKKFFFKKIIKKLFFSNFLFLVAVKRPIIKR